MSPPQRSRTAAEIGHWLGLTPRQTEVLECVRRDLPDKLIASELGTSVPTVRAHMKEIFVRLNVHRRQSAAFRWEAASVIKIDDVRSDK